MLIIPLCVILTRSMIFCSIILFVSVALYYVFKDHFIISIFLIIFFADETSNDM